MQKNQIFKDYRSTFVREGILRSFAFGLCVGASLLTVVALVCWLCGYNAGLFIAIGIGVGVGVACGFATYFIKFRPTDEYIAARLDALGLQERSITMLELAQDDSYIAKRQRADAASHISKVDKKSIKIQLSAALIIMAIIPTVFAISMTTVGALVIADVLPSGNEIISPSVPDYIEVNYIAEEGGTIYGEEIQILISGEDAQPVTAVPDEGWIFIGWDDESSDPDRQDFGVTENITYTAIFANINEDGDGLTVGPSESSDGAQGGDDAPDKPINGGSSDQDGNVNGGGGDEGSGSNDKNEDTTDIVGGGEGNGDGSNAGGGSDRYNSSNQIIDGETFYRDDLEGYKEEVNEIISSDEELTPEEKALIEKYFNSL